MTGTGHVFLGITLAALCLTAAIPTVRAQDPAANAPEYELPASEDAHPIIRLTPDKSEIVRLEHEVGSLVVGNPATLNVLVDSAKTLILVPREPGATHFTVLDKDGKTIMQRHVIVASPKDQYIRIRRSCANTDDQSCAQTSVYYCPDMCHAVPIMSADQGMPATPSAGVPAAATPLTQTTPSVPDETPTESDTVSEEE